MKYTKLGTTGLDVSRICLGCMSFGDATNWLHKWVLDEADSRTIIKKALDLGINFFDTANVYSMGVSEEILGRALKDYANRDEIVIATKVFSTMRQSPNGGGLSRKAILSELDHSLRRLGTDYVDLYIIHRFDYHTPIEETMEALNDVVRAGKVRYLGASAMYAWQFQKARNIAESRGWSNFVSMQNHWNLLYREEEREMVPYCQDAGVALTPYSPLAAGRLSRKPGEGETKRHQTDQIAISKYAKTEDQDSGIIEHVSKLAADHGVSMSQVALAWLMHKPMLAAPIIGATKLPHVEDAVKAVDIQLSEDEMSYLEELYLPHDVVGAL
ncbi:MAG: aldo/keto reductase [Clostridiales bacterium]|nr:aldo/keto reductase [Clostridiales bacterium]